VHDSKTVRAASASMTRRAAVLVALRTEVRKPRHPTPRRRVPIGCTNRLAAGDSTRTTPELVRGAADAAWLVVANTERGGRTRAGDRRRQIVVHIASMSNCSPLVVRAGETQRAPCDAGIGREPDSRPARPVAAPATDGTATVREHHREQLRALGLGQIVADESWRRKIAVTPGSGRSARGADARRRRRHARRKMPACGAIDEDGTAPSLPQLYGGMIDLEPSDQVAGDSATGRTTTTSVWPPSATTADGNGSRDANAAPMSTGLRSAYQTQARPQLRYDLIGACLV